MESPDYVPSEERKRELDAIAEEMLFERISYEVDRSFSELADLDFGFEDCFPRYVSNKEGCWTLERYNSELDFVHRNVKTRWDENEPPDYHYGAQRLVMRAKDQLKWERKNDYVTPGLQEFVVDWSYVVSTTDQLYVTDCKAGKPRYRQMLSERIAAKAAEESSS